MLFFIGAGCSRSAGVPLAGEIARDLVTRLAETYRLGSGLTPEQALENLSHKGHFQKPKGHEIDWYSVYDACFQEHYKTPDHARTIFQRAVASANGKINWAHLCLGELVSQGYCSTIITTNFDLLALEGLAAAGVIPVVSDGLESLGRIDGNPIYPQLIQLNGSIHTYRLRNKPDEIEAVAKDDVAAACVRDLVRSTSTIVFIGYAGREKAIMGLLKKALTEFSEKEIFWCSFEGNPSSIGEAAREIIDDNPNARILLNQDADMFFFELCRDLGIGSPRFVRDPLGAIARQSSRIVKPSEHSATHEISMEIDRHSEMLEKLEEFERTNRETHKSQTMLDIAREQRLRGDFKASLNTLTQALSDPNVHANVIDDAADSAFMVAQASQDPSEIAEALRLSRLSASRWETGTFNWAVAQSRLGDALWLAATGHADVALLMSAVEAYEAALGEIDKEDHPNVWARLQDGIGVALMQAADISKDTSLLEKALTALDNALTVRTREKQPIQWAETQCNKAIALFTLGEQKNDVETLRLAAKLQEEALQESTKKLLPTNWAAGTLNLASIYGAIGYLTDDTASLTKSLLLYDELAAEASDSESPSDVAGRLQNKANVIMSLAEINRDTDLCDKATDLLMGAIRTFEELGMEFFADNAKDTLARIARMRTQFLESAKDPSH
ncbi:SIR2 family protein [Brevundimonas sp. Root1279]|uniref:SIR2 family protein n=1 Tax=Brevundimonas sp. Root1279 TaxID=1736443 RepID=UPI00138F40E6|nr:SIR2 family protein [Brevundimonas sp. Root1279]